MTDKILAEVRAASENFKNCILQKVTLDRTRQTVVVSLVTDRAFSAADKQKVASVLQNYVPAYFKCEAEICKLTPDCNMVKHKILEAVNAVSKAVYSVLEEDDISVKKTENGFEYTISVLNGIAPADMCAKITDCLKRAFCGEFSGKCIEGEKNLQDLATDEPLDEVEFETPVRTFEISDFEIIEGEKIQNRAVYLSDLNFAADETVVCGTIESIKQRAYTNKKGVEKTFLSLVINDTTASAYITYFLRQKSAEKILRLKEGDSIVCTGANEEFKGNLRFTAKFIDYGKIPKGFVPEKRTSKPVPAHYHFVKPQPFSDIEQTDIFTERTIPACLKGKSFVVFDLETTGLNSSPVSGNMDKIIEIGAYKILDGEIKESFSTFINPEKRLSDEIVALTGITENMVASAPKYEEAMPDFFKFCYGSTLVGHNIVGFDFKFVDYYWSRLGYIAERKLIDTIPLSQEQLFLSNYKLNTVAEKFGIAFNHHRATDDALATAKIFIELIKLKKSLPKLQ